MEDLKYDLNSNSIILKLLFKICIEFLFFSWNLPLNPIKIPVFYYKAERHIPHTFIYETDDKDIWGLPELEYPGLVKVRK